MANAIQNGDFSDAFTHWNSNSGGSDVGGAIVDDPDQPGNPVFYIGSETRKSQGPIPVEVGDKWRLSYRLRSTVYISSFGLASNNGTSWITTGSIGTYSTGGQWQWIEKVVTIPTGVSNVWVRFAIGGSPGIYVDDVSLTLIERGGGGTGNDCPR